MSDECRNRVTPVPCEEVMKEADDLSRPSWSVCLPFGGRLWSAYGNVMYDSGVAPRDGTYTSVTIQGGCIVGVGHAQPPAPTYTPVDCAADPVSCAADLPPLPQETVVIRPADNPTDAGAGECGCIVLGSSQIAVTGDGSADAPYRIEHNRNHGATINGMVFDEYGHLTNSYNTEDTSTANVSQVVGGEFITVDVANGVANVSLDRMDKHGGEVIIGEYEIGGWTFTFDRNRIAKLEKKQQDGGGVGGAINPLFYHPSPQSEQPQTYRFTLIDQADVLVCEGYTTQFSEVSAGHPGLPSFPASGSAVVTIRGDSVSKTLSPWYVPIVQTQETYNGGETGVPEYTTGGHCKLIYAFDGPFPAGDYEIEFAGASSSRIVQFKIDPRNKLK